MRFQLAWVRATTQSALQTNPLESPESAGNGRNFPSIPFQTGPEKVSAKGGALPPRPFSVGEPEQKFQKVPPAKAMPSSGESPLSLFAFSRRSNTDRRTYQA
jgi:hypothetical protein